MTWVMLAERPPDIRYDCLSCPPPRRGIMSLSIRRDQSQELDVGVVDRCYYQLQICLHKEKVLVDMRIHDRPWKQSLYFLLVFYFLRLSQSKKVRWSSKRRTFTFCNNARDK
jgi:hypothetical protein